MDEQYINRSTEANVSENVDTTKVGMAENTDAGRANVSDAVREEILNAAIEKMRIVGIRSVSIDDICRQLGMSKKTFYVYFESKDQLVKDMLAVHEQQMEQRMLREVEGKSVIEILHQWGPMARKNEKNLEQPPPIMYDLQKYYPALCNLHKEHICSMMCRNLMRFLRKGQAEGVFRKDIDADLTAQLFSYSHYLVMEQIQQYPKRREEIIAIARQGLEILGKGMLTEQGLTALKALETPAETAKQ